jgi:hypothetical protein
MIPLICTLFRRLCLNVYRLSVSTLGLDVPLVALPEAPCSTGRTVPTLHVANSPLDLSPCICLPVRASAGHLRTRQCLWYAVCSAWIFGGNPPTTFPVEDITGAGSLCLITPPVTSKYAHQVGTICCASTIVVVDARVSLTVNATCWRRRRRRRYRSTATTPR